MANKIVGKSKQNYKINPEINDFKKYINDTYNRISQNTTDEIFIYNNLDELKLLCNKYKIRLTVYNNDKEQIYSNNVNQSKTYKSIYLIFNNNKYNICEKINKSTKNITYIGRIASFKKRDTDKNKKTILLDDLFKNKDTYKMYMISFGNTFEFKYEYLTKKVHNKKVIDLVNEDYDLLKYLLLYFGMYICLRKLDYLGFIQINKEDINKEFIEKYNEYYLYLYDKTNERIDKIFIRDFLDHNKLIDIIKDKEKMTDNKLEIKIHQTANINEYLINLNYIDTPNIISSDDIDKLLEENTVCNMCNKILEVNIKNGFTIDSINPMLGHVKNNCCLLCRNCNSTKGIRYIGKYSDKPYFYDIKQLNTDELIKIMTYHKLNIKGDKYKLIDRLERFLKTIDSEENEIESEDEEEKPKKIIISKIKTKKK